MYSDSIIGSYNQTVGTWMTFLSLHNNRGSMHRQIINLIVQRIIERNNLSRASFSPVELDI